MNCLAQIWYLLGKNSGQLQLLLALFALYLAWQAAKYAKKQISIAQAQRSSELKLQLLNSAHEYLMVIIDLRHKFKVYKTEFYEKFNLEGGELVEGCNYTNDTYFQKIESLLDSPEHLMNKMVEALGDENLNLTIPQLEEYLKSICSTGNKLRSSNIGLNNRFDELRRTKGSE